MVLCVELCYLFDYETSYMELICMSVAFSMDNHCKLNPVTHSLNCSTYKQLRPLHTYQLCQLDYMYYMFYLGCIIFAKVSQNLTASI